MVLPLALGLASGGLSLFGSIQSAKTARAVAKFQKKLQEANNKIAAEAANRNIVAIQRRQVQEHAALSQQTISVADQARRALAVATTQSADSGTSGNSLAALIDDFERQKLDAQQALIRSQKFRDTAAKDQVLNVRSAQRTNALNSLPDPVSIPSFLEAAGNALQSGLGTFSQAGGTF